MAKGVTKMSMKRAFRLSLAAIPLVLGLVSCSLAQAKDDNPCKSPEFGIAEEGFANCTPPDAFARLQELAKQDDPKALYMLGRVYNMGGDDFGLPKVKQNYNQAMKYFVRSAKLGYAEAQDTIARYYGRYYRDTRDRESAYWACRAAMQNYPPAVTGIQLQIKVAGLKQTVSQYCAPILKSPPRQEDQG